MNMEKVLKTVLHNTILAWFLVLACMALIFSFSHQPGEKSAEISGEVTEIIIQTVEKITPKAEVDKDTFHGTLRKSAHFFAYFLLGLLMINALRASNKKGHRGLLWALILCVLYAITDEVHQTFIPGRSGEISDVILDSVGSSVGIGLYWLGETLYSWKKQREY